MKCELKGFGSMNIPQCSLGLFKFLRKTFECSFRALIFLMFLKCPFNHHEYAGLPRNPQATTKIPGNSEKSPGIFRSPDYGYGSGGALKTFRQNIGKKKSKVKSEQIIW